MPAIGLRNFTLTGCTLAAIIAGCGPAIAAPPAPPASDGSSGSFSQQLNGNFNSFNVDSGQGQGCNTTYCPYQVTVPFKTATYAGKKVHIFNFTDIDMPAGNQPITIYGNMAAMFLASQGISIGGRLVFLNDAAVTQGGAASEYGGSGYGGPGGGLAGGGGGAGPGGETSFCNSTGPLTAGGGGGGGNVSPGTAGDPGINAQYSNVPNYAGGAGGTGQRLTFIGGSGGGAGGGGSFEGNYYATVGGQGGGAIVFGATGDFAIVSGGVINVAGSPGQLRSYSEGSSGGGAGGAAFLFATGNFTNAGQILATGGAGGNELLPTNCSGGEPAPGPDGGNGGGGRLFIQAATITNNGSVVLSGGSSVDGSAGGGSISFSGTVLRGSGTIIGRKN